MDQPVKNRIRFLAAALFSTMVLILLLPMVADLNQQVSAKTTSEKIDEANKEKDKLEQELKDQQEDIAGLKGEKKTLQKELSNLNTQLEEISDKLADLGAQIFEKEEEIKQTTQELEDAIATEEWQYACMVIRIQDMYERNDTSYLNSILSANSLSGVLNAADWYETIAAYDRRKLEEFQENKLLVSELKQTLEEEKIVLDGLKTEAEAEKAKVAGLISQTANSISDYADQIEEAEREAEEYEKKIKEKEKDLEYLKKVLEEEIRLSKLAAQATWRNISEVTFADGDRYLLANLIYCEAGGEPYEGKLAVGAVVINRVLSSKYADTVVGVIYQKSQFSPVGSGRLSLAMTYSKANADCYRAADEAMSGITNVGNCVYFRTPVPGLTGIQIGNHIFY